MMLRNSRFRLPAGGFVFLILGLFCLGLCGCAPKEQLGDKKEDWAKTPPPPTYRGPGQPGGPPGGASSGPASAVPPGATGGKSSTP